METSNLQELKDAATELMSFTCNSCERRFCEEDVEEEDGQRVPSPCSAISRMRNALYAHPIRNCDRFVEEMDARIAFISYYNEMYDLKGSKYEIDTCDLKHNVEGILNDYIEWLFAPANENTKGE